MIITAVKFEASLKRAFEFEGCYLVLNWILMSTALLCKHLLHCTQEPFSAFDIDAFHGTETCSWPLLGQLFVVKRLFNLLRPKFFHGMHF